MPMVCITWHGETILGTQRSLEEKVLIHLIEQGSEKWAAVYLYFDDATGEFGPALRALESLKQIECDDKGYVEITQTGFERITKEKIEPPIVRSMSQV
jgi:predicted methyltransferase